MLRRVQRLMCSSLVRPPGFHPPAPPSTEETLLVEVQKALADVPLLDASQVLALRQSVESLSKRVGTAAVDASAVARALDHADHLMEHVRTLQGRHVALKGQVDGMEAHFTKRLEALEKASKTAPSGHLRPANNRVPGLVIEHKGKEIVMVNMVAVSGFPKGTTTTQVQSFLAPAGEVQGVYTDVVGGPGGTSREVMIATFKSVHDAARALEYLDGTAMGNAMGVIVEPYVSSTITPYVPEEFS